jgi:hypothetical protein
MARLWAVLIDAENVEAQVADPLFDRLSGRGDTAVRKMYGNFAASHVNWQAAASRHSIEPVHLPNMVAGRNGADIALVIDAVDLMHRGHVDGFCLVSSDSDFTRLACRLRAEGKTVFGVGKSAVTDAFGNACSEFISVEMLIGEAERGAAPSNVSIIPIRPIIDLFRPSSALRLT